MTAWLALMLTYAYVVVCDDKDLAQNTVDAFVTVTS